MLQGSACPSEHLCFVLADPEDLAAFLLASIPLPALGTALRRGVPGRTAQPKGACLRRGAIFKAAEGPGGLFPGSAALAGTCQVLWWGSGSCSCSPAWILSGGREGPSRVASPGWLCFTAGQGLSPAKSFRRGGKKAVCETHFCCTSGAAALPSPRAVSEGQLPTPNSPSPKEGASLPWP